MKRELPKNWIHTKLEQVVTSKKGKKPKKLMDIEFENSVPYLDIKAFEKNEIRRYADIPSSNIIEETQIGIVWDGARSGWVTKGKYGAVGSTIAILSPKGVNENYLLKFLESKFDYINTNTRGTGIPHVDPKILWDIDFPLPPLYEQNRIVDKLDKLIEQLEVIKDGIKTLSGIKEKFIYGCLVNTQTAQFFHRQKIGRYLEEGTERIGKNWSKSRKIGVSAKKGIIELSIGQKKTFENYKVVRQGDFIYNTMRVNIGSVAIYTGKENAITSPDYVVFRVKNFLSSELLLGFLKSDQGLLEIGANTKGSVRARLYFKSLSEIRMPVSGEETQILAQKFLSSFSISLRKLKKISKTKFVDLEKAILNKAFKGELVAQLESDGDARELLEEIRHLKEKDSAKAVKGNKKNKKYETGDVELSMAAEVIDHKYARKE